MPSALPVFDLVVVEATPAGIAMAVRAAREGLHVLLTNRGRHVGGMLTSGVGVWDTLIEGKRAPLYDEVRAAIQAYYRNNYGEDSPQYEASLPAEAGHRNGCFEPSVAERVLESVLAGEPRLTLWRECSPAEVELDGSRVAAVVFGPARRRVEAAVFADCTYEGDFAALAGVPCRVGREGRAEHGESHAGWIMLRPRTTTPEKALSSLAVRRRDWALRRFEGFSEEVESPVSGAADHRVQACNYRTILTRVPANRVPVERPRDYDRTMLAGLEFDSRVEPLPNGKVSWNRPQLIGRQYAYALGSELERKRIRDEHWNATLGLLYFLQHDASLPVEVHQAWRGYGLAKDEFADNQHRPYELYVREARRIVGRATLTQNDLVPSDSEDRARPCADGIVATDWYVDVHACGPEQVEGSYLEGKMMLHIETVPSQVPYGALVPCNRSNLLVPVCLSATHVAHSAVRVEPTWMALGEAAGFAAAQAVRTLTPVAEIEVAALQKTLVASGVVVAPTEWVRTPAKTAQLNSFAHGL